MIPRSWLSAGQCEVTMTSQNVLRGAGGSDDAGDGWLPPPPLVVKNETVSLDPTCDSSVSFRWCRLFQGLVAFWYA